MAAKQHLELFFERFLEFNLERYQDNPEYLAAFTGLTFAEVTYTDIVPTDAGARRSATVNSVARNFHGVNQSWTPAPAATDLKLYNLKNTVALASIDDLADQTVAGLYSYVDGVATKVGVVIGSDVEEADHGSAVKAVLDANVRYAVQATTFQDVAATITLTGDTFEGVLAWAVGTAPVMIIPDTDYGQLEGADVPAE